MRFYFPGIATHARLLAAVARNEVLATPTERTVRLVLVPTAQSPATLGEPGHLSLDGAHRCHPPYALACAGRAARVRTRILHGGLVELEGVPWAALGDGVGDGVERG